MIYRLVRRIDARIVPTCMLIYLLCYLDRANIGNAKVLNAVKAGHDASVALGEAVRVSTTNCVFSIFIIYRKVKVPI